jgi:aerobic-type carbon monoxide dehydrogenase small subunit (CoxS/CutS family)
MSVSETVEFVVNGRPVSFDGDGTAPLLSVLRDELALRGTKFGCGNEQCGACMVLVDGKPEHSCACELASVCSRTVTTIEGLAAGGALHPLQQAFLD